MHITHTRDPTSYTARTGDNDYHINIYKTTHGMHGGAAQRHEEAEKYTQKRKSKNKKIRQTKPKLDEEEKKNAKNLCKSSL